MKKLLILVSALALVFTSCSSESSSSSSNTPILVTKIIETFEDNSTWTIQYKYSGTKLVKIIDDEGYATFTYNGNLITEVKHYESNTLVQTDTYEYDANGKVVSFVMIDNIDTDWGDKETYTYNSNGSITVNHYIGDAFSQTTLNDTGTITFLNGEIYQISNSSGKTTTYTYDTKNTPFLNVTGVDKIAYCGFEGQGVLHNIIEEDDSDNLDDMTVVYMYNSNDFPVSSIITYPGEVITEEYFYNQ